MVPSETNSVVFFFFFSRLDRQRTRCPRRMCFCQRVLVIGIVLQLWACRQDTVRAPRFSGNTRILAVRMPSGPHVLRFPRGRICLLPNRKASRTKICIVLHLPSSEFDSCFGPTPTCLVVSLGVYSLSWCSRCIQILCDEECVSQVRFSMSKNCSV